MNPSLKERIMINTGLSEPESEIYIAFVEGADLSDKVIMFGNVKHDIEQLIKKGKNTATPEEIRYSSEKTYNYWLEKFKETGLIHKVEMQTQFASYPVLKGYTPFDDKEIYISYKHKGESDWTGRMPRSMFSEMFNEMKNNYEFQF